MPLKFFLMILIKSSPVQAKNFSESFRIDGFHFRMCRCRLPVNSIGSSNDIWSSWPSRELLKIIRFNKMQIAVFRQISPQEEVY